MLIQECVTYSNALLHCYAYVLYFHPDKMPAISASESQHPSLVEMIAGRIHDPMSWIWVEMQRW